MAKRVILQKDGTLQPAQIKDIFPKKDLTNYFRLLIIISIISLISIIRLY